MIDHSKLNTSSLHVDRWGHYPEHLEGSEARPLLVARLIDNEGRGLVHMVLIRVRPLNQMIYI